jgi:hypothetical protein
MMPGDTFTTMVEIVVADALRHALDISSTRLSPALERRLVADLIDHWTGAGWRLTHRTTDRGDRMTRRLDTTDWTDEQWEGRARMADARRHAGLDLDSVDREALTRYPDPPAGTS